jgi:3-hydroxyisobutyrate dehydrogenase-like beta-hydroxyacid dehydrogenase
MGLPMATNLQRHLSQKGAPSLRYFNRTISRGDSLKDIGGVAATSIKDLVSNTDIIFMSLSDDGALKSTLQSVLSPEAAEHLSGKIIVDTSTVHPDTTVQAQKQLADKGAQFVASPVFGASPVAAQGKLLWILAGPQDAVEAIIPYIVAVMGRGFIRLGEDVRQSSLLKTAGWALFLLATRLC